VSNKAAEFFLKRDEGTSPTACDDQKISEINSEVCKIWRASADNKGTTQTPKSEEANPIPQRFKDSTIGSRVER
jgi:hypothetical protein